MGLTYDGITYRSLEEQVRYDAEQVQLLKQADVTINESLQTINTEISGKLNKPTNPSAESAVTMLADGTVSTKPLSEIGGGKLYRHFIMLSEAEDTVFFYVFSTRSTSYTFQEVQQLFSHQAVAYGGGLGNGAIECYFISGSTYLKGVLIGIDDQPVVISHSYSSMSFSDSVTEL